MGVTRTIKEFVFYDDVDPHALDSGIVIINGRRLGRLWEHCRSTRQDVVADIHVHPWGYGQSLSDQANPIIPRRGHIALILPEFAEGTYRPSEFGIYRYEGGNAWRDLSRLWPTAMIIGADR